ncbi:MAG: hypothetical protein ACPLZG_11360, partial [Thermoproteota archaeon]
MSEKKEVDKKIVLELLKNPHVTAVDNYLRPRIRGGKEVPEEKCIRVYVEKKLPLSALKEEEVIPKTVGDIPTDVVESGKIVALILMPVPKSLEFDPKARVRPITGGISFGNVSITANTIGWFYVDKNGNKYIGSNAHCLTPDPFADPSQVSPKEVVQPASYDGGKLPNDLIGHYVWHKKLEPESSGVFNKIDFALSTIEVDCDFKIWQQYTPSKLVGHLFAGSDTLTVVFKEKYVLQEGYTPLNAEVVEVKEGDWVEKWSRNGYGYAQVTSTSATVKVWYGNNEFAIFTDQVLTTALARGGCSGSSVWLRPAPEVTTIKYKSVNDDWMRWLLIAERKEDCEFGNPNA